jgi:hypothetical protein
LPVWPSGHQKRAAEFGEGLFVHVRKKIPHRLFVFRIPKIRPSFGPFLVCIFCCDRFGGGRFVLESAVASGKRFWEKEGTSLINSLIIVKTLLYKIPPNLPLPKGGIIPLFGKEARGDFLNNVYLIMRPLIKT